MNGEVEREEKVSWRRKDELGEGDEEERMSLKETRREKMN